MQNKNQNIMSYHMKCIRSILVLAAVTAGTLLYGQGFVMPENTVSWKVSAEHVNDSTYKVVFTGKIADGWHTYGIGSDHVTLWGTGKPMREFLWSEEMADASVHVLLNVDFKDTYEPGCKEIRNCHINVGTGKEISIRDVAMLIQKEIGFAGEIRWDSSKPDGTLKKLTDVTKLHQLGWHHQVVIEEGIHRLYEWYLH